MEIIRAKYLKDNVTGKTTTVYIPKTSYINRSGSGSNYVKSTSMILMEVQA